MVLIKEALTLSFIWALMEVAEKEAPQDYRHSLRYDLREPEVSHG